LDDRVSRKHLQIHFDQDKQQHHALDMKSKHGVLVNGARIKKEVSLGDGDQIRIGDTTLLFSVKDFPDRESALSHFKKVGERTRTTLID
jgi:pSer/pThr/pTyr-binding forkhead associated (FHA) protein